MKKNILKKSIVILSLALIVFLGCPNTTKAGSWGENFAANLMQIAKEQAIITFKEVMLANLKKQAAKLISDRVKALLTGRRASRPSFITNYDDFIYGSVEKVARKYTQSLFRSATNSVSSYTRLVLKRAENAIINQMQDGIDQAVATVDMYAQEGFRSIFDPVKGGGDAAVMAMVSNPYNNSWGAYERAMAAAMAESERTKQLGIVEATNGGGFLGTVDSETNLISTPGKIIQEISAYVETMPMRMIVSAKGVGEVIGQMAAQMVSQTIQSGISKVTEPIDEELIQVNRSVRKKVNKFQRDIYDGIKFVD